MNRSIVDIQKDINIMLNGEGVSKTYDVWYHTPIRKSTKHKVFDSITQIEDWCKINKEKVKITSASWQVLEIMNSLKGLQVLTQVKKDDTFHF